MKPPSMRTFRVRLMATLAARRKPVSPRATTVMIGLPAGETARDYERGGKGVDGYVVLAGYGVSKFSGLVAGRVVFCPLLSMHLRPKF